jgi:ubiquinone/menaquinone biosynthesis C-methylase UbiE
MSTRRQGPAGKSRDDIAAAYASPPWWYDVRGFFILTFAYNSTLTHQLRFFGPHMSRRHLEVACGTGTLLDLALRWRAWKGLPEPHITAIDYAESMLAGARRRFRRRPNIEVRHADAAALPCPDASFDTVNIANSIHCFPDMDGALHEVARVLTPGGTLALNALLYPRGPWPLKQIAQRIDEWGVRRGILYSPLVEADVSQRVEGAGLRIQSARTSGNCFDVVARKPQ